jgi:hypothetical protein
MILLKDKDDPRRRQLLQALAAGVLGLALPSQRTAYADILGKVPGELPPGRSIYDLVGEVKVNGTKATLETKIGPSDTVETGANSLIIFVVGKDSFIMRSNSKMVLKGERGVMESMLLLSGKLLSVFGKSKHQLRTPTAIVGIRGTGVYAEVDPQETYFCTCYGVVEVTSANDPSSRETISATHHDKPIYIAAGQQAGKSIRSAPFKNHTDSELMLIETIVGRTPPFSFAADEYIAPRREY